MSSEEKKAPALLHVLKGKWVLFLLAAACILLLWAGGSETHTEAGTQDLSTDPAAAENYRAALEEDLRALCARVDGVGEISLVITLESGTRAVYATDLSSSGNREHVTHGGEGLLLYQEAPAIRGVAVVCEGGCDPAVVEALVSLLSTACGVGSNRIAVCAGGGGP